ncbi:transposase, partial [Aliifodinibius sp. S!AR15-10]|uniref:IS110 family transposase n=1 Tax=Aliifodinibius sp. S!AR15-10 TaxID=2950437 RepID=UPI00285D92CC
MEGNYWVGIDVSQKQLDWEITTSGNQPAGAGLAANSPRGITRMLSGWTSRGIGLEQMIICFEHTGPYGLLLAAMLEQAGACYVMVSAAEVQHSLGIRRGKTDPIDAGRLAEYCWRFRDRLRPSRLPSGALLELRGWLLWRERLVKMRTG